MGLIRLESDESGYSGVFHGWMENLPKGDLRTTKIYMENLDPPVLTNRRVRLVQEGRLLLETRLEALLEGVQITLPVVGDIFFEVIPGGRFTMSIEWAHALEVVAGEEPGVQHDTGQHS